MKLRNHRGSLKEAMETVIEIEPTIDALLHVINDGRDWNIKKEDVKVEKYTYDDRINWDTYIVTIDGYGVYGFTDGPLVNKEEL